MKLINKIKYVLTAPKSKRWAKKFSMPPVMSDYETLDYIIEQNCSICRFGDGELNLMRGVGIKFQEKDKGISDRLKEIAGATLKEDTLICIPNIFKSLNNFTPEAKKWWGNYLKCTRGYWYKYFRGSIYGDTNLTRFYVENLDKERDEYVSKLKRIWQDKNILIVEGQKSRLGMGNDLFSNTKSINRILCPSANAFKYYNKILSKVTEEVEKGNYDLLICALGPTATVLCYDLADKIQSLDLGHIDIEYEWYLVKAQTKKAVKNKSVTEVADGCDDEVDLIYKSQIIGEVNEDSASFKFVE